MSREGIYQEDLAYIHNAGHGFHWQGAAKAVLEHLRRCPDDGLIVDLGCGGGQWLARLARKGFRVFGVDASASMIRAARQSVPQGRFVTGSMADVELPRCHAVTALGEPINYLDGRTSIQRTFRRVFHALHAGGRFVFDAREPAASPVPPRTVARVGDDWACISEIEEGPQNNLLVRRITTFRQVGRHYRRGFEEHRLKVYPKRQIFDWLRACGFRVRAYRSYGAYALQPRQCAFVARKPSTP